MRLWNAHPSNEMRSFIPYIPAQYHWLRVEFQYQQSAQKYVATFEYNSEPSRTKHRRDGIVIFDGLPNKIVKQID